MNIRLWKGTHSPDLRNLIADVWSKQHELLIVCPPHLRQFDFLRHLNHQNLLNSTEPSSSTQRHPILGVFTSGTISGAPRLVLYTKQNIESSIHAIYERFDRSQIDTLFCYPQPFHTFGLLLGYVASIEFGFQLITPPGRYSSEAHRARSKVRSSRTLTLGTPTHFTDLLQWIKNEKKVLRPTYSAIIGGAQTSINLWNQCRTKLKIQAPSIGYGCTEASPGITHLDPGVPPLEDGAIGSPLKSICLNANVPNGIEISGPSLCTAIIDDKGCTRPKKLIVRDRLRQLKDGSFVFEGRTDLTLNRGGQKWSLEHFENELQKMFGLSSVCLAKPHARLGEDLSILIQRPEKVNVKTLRTSVVTFFKKNHGLRLDSASISITEKIPLTPSAKPDRIVAAAIVFYGHEAHS